MIGSQMFAKVKALVPPMSELSHVAERARKTAVALLESGPAGEEGRRMGEKWAIVGMASLLTGQKLPALSMFARGVALLEKSWRERHPEFEGGLKERVMASVSFYEETHQNETNRILHQIGIPMILGGAVGLIFTPSFSPFWVMSAGSFAIGWGLNVVGHVGFEKNRPAFSADPLSFLMGPAWDVKQIIEKLTVKPA